MGRRRVCIIANPISGLGWAHGRTERVRDILIREGCEAVLHRTGEPGHGVQLAREAVEAGFDTVVAAGGDGTVNDILQGIVDTDVALAVMPLGTANVLATELGLSAGVRRVVRLVLDGCPRRLDAGRCNGRYFICFASVGFDACVTRQMKELRNGSITHLHYVLPTWRAFWGYHFQPMRVRVDGETLGHKVYHFMVGNIRSYGGPFQMMPWARADDGLLSACAFEGRGRDWIFLYTLSLLARVHFRFNNVETFDACVFEVETDRPMPVQVDGDYFGTTPARFEVHPRAVTVLHNR